MKREEELTVSVKIKPLEWLPYAIDGSTMKAKTDLGHYVVWEIGGRGYLSTAIGEPGQAQHGDIEAAKSAAQSRHDARIRSALLPTEGVDHQAHHSNPVVSQNTQIVKDKATEGVAHEKGMTADQLCRTPIIEWLVPTTEEWNACEVMQDRYDLMKKLVRRAFKAEQYASESRTALTAKQTDGREGE